MNSRNWMDELERRRRFILFALYIVGIAAILAASFRVFAGYDVYWQIQMGKDWIENGLSPFVDHYSYTYADSKIVAPPVLFQALSYFLVDQFGEFSGFFTIRVMAFTLTIATMMWWLSRIRAPVFLYCLVIPLLACLLEIRGIVRPELFSYPLIVVSFVLYHRTAFRFSWKTMWPIAALFVFWTNYHSSIFAYVIFFGLFVDVAVRLLADRAPMQEWLKWIGWGALLLAIGFANPGHDHVLLQFLFFDERWKSLIQEYRSPLPLLKMPAIYILMAVTGSTVYLLVRQKLIGLLIVTLVFTYAAMTMGRMVTPSGITILCLFAYAVVGIQTFDWLRHSSTITRRLTGLVFSVALLIPLLNAVQVARANIKENSRPFARLPVAMADYMIAHGLRGNIFNSYPAGGYLIYRLSKQNKIYIDGRAGILYPVELLLRHSQAESDPEVFLSEAQKYDIPYAILGYAQQNAINMADAGFGLEFVDLQYALFARTSGTLQHTGLLWAKPYCWNDQIARAISTEVPLALESLPSVSPILPLLTSAQKFSESKDKVSFLLEKTADSVQLDAERKFLAYRALELGEYTYGLSQLNHLVHLDVKDVLAKSLAYLRLGDFRQAERVLDWGTRIKWPRIEFADAVIQQALLKEISKEEPLELFDQAYLDNLTKQIGDDSLPARGIQVSPEMFCSLPGN